MQVLIINATISAKVLGNYRSILSFYAQMLMLLYSRTTCFKDMHPCAVKCSCHAVGVAPCGTYQANKQVLVCLCTCGKHTTMTLHLGERYQCKCRRACEQVNKTKQNKQATYNCDTTTPSTFGLTPLVTT